MAKEKIVVIDDSPIVRKLAELALEEEGYKVYTAEDGEEGLRICEEVRPSIILVDFIMPRISGYQFCEAARDNELLKDIPIILITGKGEDVGKKFSEKFGVVDYFIKPFKSEVLIEKVNAIVYSQRLRSEEEQPEFRAETPAAAASATEWKTEESYAPVFSPAEAVEPEPFAPVIPEMPQPSADPFDFSKLEPAQGDSSFGFDMPEFGAASASPAAFAAETPSAFKGSYDLDMKNDFGSMSGFDAPAFGGGSAAVAGAGAASGDIEAIMKRYFGEELPTLIEKNIEHVLKQYGIIKDSAILLSGSLEDIRGVEVLRLIESQRLTGKFFAYTQSGSAEIYFEKGKVVYALTSKQGKTLTTRRLAIIKKSTMNDVGDKARETMTEAVQYISQLREGGFFFERMSVPKTLKDMTQRASAMALLIEGLRRAAEIDMQGNPEMAPVVFVRSAADYYLNGLGLNAAERDILSLVDGVRSASDIGGLSGLGMPEASKILYRLYKAGVVADKGGM